MATKSLTAQVLPIDAEFTKTNTYIDNQRCQPFIEPDMRWFGYMSEYKLVAEDILFLAKLRCIYENKMDADKLHTIKNQDYAIVEFKTLATHSSSGIGFSYKSQMKLFKRLERKNLIRSIEKDQDSIYFTFNMEVLENGLTW